MDAEEIRSADPHVVADGHHLQFDRDVLQVADRIRAYERAGVDLLLLQCSPQLEEMERFAETVIPLVRGRVAHAA